VEVSDNFEVTIAGDYAYQNQPSYPTHGSRCVDAGRRCAADGIQCLAAGPYGFMGAQYNYCISTPRRCSDPAAFSAATGAPPFFSTGSADCADRARRPEPRDGRRAAGRRGLCRRSGAVYSRAVSPAILRPGIRAFTGTLANTRHGDIDKTYANGPSFAQYTAWVGRSRSTGPVDSMAFKSITAARGIDWKVGVDLDGLPETIQEVTDHQSQQQFSQEFQLTGKALERQARLRRRPVLLPGRRLRARLRAVRQHAVHL
jgi:hypothetical protein